MPISINTLIAWHTKGETPKIERVLYLNTQANLVYTIDITDPDALPMAHSYSDISAALQNLDATIAIEEPNLLRLIPPKPPSDCALKSYQRWEERIRKAHKLRDEAWTIIEPLISSPDIFNSMTRGRVITDRVKETGVAKKTIYGYLRRYWQGGMLKNALLPLYVNSGGKGKQREPQTKKLGRPNKLVVAGEASPGINVDTRIRLIFFKGLQKYYNTPARHTLKQAFEKLTRQYFVRVNDQGNGQMTELLAPTERPTFDQFRYWYQTYGEPMKAWSRRVRALRYEQMLHSPLQDVTLAAFGPGTCFQVDATIADIYLVSSLNPQRIIGRPVIYIVKDLFSRMIVGFAILLEGPSWLGAMLALENATMDKVAFCKDHGIDITEDDWPCHHLPIKLTADRGEFEGYNADNLTDGLNIEVENTAPFRAEWKAIVERDFGLCNERFIHFMPGSVVPRERGDKDYRLDACLTMKDMRQLMIYRILQYNHSHRLEEYELDEYMIRDQVERYPIDLWWWGIKNRVGALRTLPQDIIRQNLLYRAEGSVTRHGIRFQGLRYTCATAKNEFWFPTARRKGSWKRPVFFDPRCLDTIFIQHDNGSMEPCVLLERKKAFKQRSWYEIRDYDAHVVQSRLHRRSKDDQSIADFDQNVERIKESAQKRQKAIVSHLPPASKRERLTNIRSNRQAERELERRNNAWFGTDQDPQSSIESPSTIDTALPAPPVTADPTPPQRKPNSDYDFLRQVREKKRNVEHE